MRAHPTLLRVDFQHLVHVLGEVDDDSAVYGLPGEAGSAAARQNRNVVLVGGRNDCNDIVGRLRHDDGYRLDLIDARVGAVQQASHPVRAHFPVDVALQILDQRAVVIVSHLSKHGCVCGSSRGPDREKSCGGRKRKPNPFPTVGKFVLWESSGGGSTRGEAGYDTLSIKYVILPPGVMTSTSFPSGSLMTFFPIGDLSDNFPSNGLASSALTIVY